MNTDVCVIGGGPAGAVIAQRLRQLGHEVTVVERERFPRRHVGESLPPSIGPLLDSIGARECVDRADFLRPTKTVVQWSEPTATIRDLHGDEPGYQVDRGRFDQLLLTAAQKAGAKVLQPARTIAAQRHAERDWRVRVQAADGRKVLHSQFIVDASGRSSFLPGERKRFLEPTLAIYGYWRGTKLKGNETRIEAGRDRWYWGTPLPDGTVNATVFVDPKQLAAKAGGLEGFYRKKVGESTLLRECLAGHLVSKVHACDAGGCYATSPITIDSLKVGEASYSIDPLSSQGVQAAVSSAIQGAVAVHTLLAKPDRPESTIQFIENRQQEAIDQHREWSARFYSEHQLHAHQSFWQRRSSHALRAKPTAPHPTLVPRPTRLRLSPAAKLTDTPVIRGEFIDTLPALSHPALRRPVAWLYSVEVARLLAMVIDPVSFDDLCQRWSNLVPSNTCQTIIRWMLSHSILISEDRGEARDNRRIQWTQ